MLCFAESRWSRKKAKMPFALYGNTKSYNRSAVGGEAFRSLRLSTTPTTLMVIKHYYFLYSCIYIKTLYIYILIEKLIRSIFFYITPVSDSDSNILGYH